jgi:hypothetical protein
MDEFDKPIQGTPSSRIGEPSRRGAPLGILHEWKARLKEIEGEIEATRARPKYDPTSPVNRRRIEEELKLEREIANVERIREARKAATRQAPPPVVAAPLPGTWEELRNQSSISQKEAAQFLKCDPRTIRRRVTDKELTRSPKGRIVCNERLRNQIRKVHGEHVLR